MRTKLKKILQGKSRLEKNINRQIQIESLAKTNCEINKNVSRTDIINYLFTLFNRQTYYLEIGVRNPNDNFNHIKANKKYSVDPGIEFKENPVDFKMTSDMFFYNLSLNKLLPSDIKFDIIFIDGLHLAEQVNRDIINSLEYLNDDGFIILHDCNPPTEWHARETFEYTKSPAEGHWNGTTWKAFLKWRMEKSLFSCCINTDWGVGILSKKINIGVNIPTSNTFFEFNVLDQNRGEYLNLVDFKTFKGIVEKYIPVH